MLSTQIAVSDGCFEDNRPWKPAVGLYGQMDQGLLRILNNYGWIDDQHRGFNKAPY
jgi:hypothetical protein